MSANTRIERPCETCGKLVSVKPSHAAKGHGRFCSLVCWGKYKTINGIGPPRRKVACVCESCSETFMVKPSQLIRGDGRGRFCSRECLAVGKRVPLESRFRQSIGDPLPNGCIPWTGATGHFGYGYLMDTREPETRKQFRWLAHRLAWTYANGPIPEGMIVCHRCDNPVCVNPDHLFLGTYQDNTRDMIAKCRASWQKTRAGSESVSGPT